MARSFTVPLTARSPMLPPGKISGRTTNESVVKARRDPFTESTAPSWRCSSASFEKAGIKIFSMSWCVSLPPPPCASTMRSSATRGTGQLRLNEVVVLTSAIVIVSSTRAFGRYHGRAQRIFRRALHGKCRTLVRFLDALQNQPTDAFGRFSRRLPSRRITAVGIVLLETSAQLESARGYFAQASPLARHDFEDLRDAILRWTIPFPPHRARVLVLDFVSAFFQLCHGHVDAFENVERLESSDHDGDFVFFSDREIFFETHHGANVTGGEESLHYTVIRREQGFHCGRHEHMGDKQGKIVDTIMIGLPCGHGICGRGSFEPYGKEDNLLRGIRLRQLQR